MTAQPRGPRISADRIEVFDPHEGPDLVARSMHPMPRYVTEAHVALLPTPRHEMPAFVQMLIAHSALDQIGKPNPRGFARASRQRDGRGPFGKTVSFNVLFEWIDCPDGRVALGWRHELVKSPSQRAVGLDPGGEVKAAVRTSWERWAATWKPTETMRDPVLGPGGAPPRRWSGQMRDYSRCAGLDDVRDLVDGNLPLGRYVGLQPSSPGWPVRSSLGPMLGLPEGTEFRGTLVCAPSGAGKTEFLLRWATASLDVGHSVLVVDVKGSMYAKLRERLSQRPGSKRPKIYRLSTNPRAVSGDRMNLLADIDAETEEGQDAIRRLAEAIIPDAGFAGQDENFYRNRLDWLSALIGLVKLHETYYEADSRLLPRRKREHDMSDVWELARSERRLCDLIAYIAVRELEAAAQGRRFVEPGVEYWATDLAPVVGQTQMLSSWKHEVASQSGAVPLPDIPPIEGGRSERETFQLLMINVNNALRLFDPKRAVYRVLSGDPRLPNAGERFALADLGRSEQMALVVEAMGTSKREQNAVLSMIVASIEAIVNERFLEADPRAHMQPLMLLLDETRRIRGFDPERFISFEREAKAGTVVVYQGLGQIAEEANRTATKAVTWEPVHELLKAVGTVIFLREAIGDDYDQLVKILHDDSREEHETTTSTDVDGTSTSTRRIREQVRFFDSLALAKLPGGPFAALVLMRDRPSVKPVLVDMDNRHFAVARRRPAAQRRGSSRRSSQGRRSRKQEG